MTIDLPLISNHGRGLVSPISDVVASQHRVEGSSHHQGKEEELIEQIGCKEICLWPSSFGFLGMPPFHVVEPRSSNNSRVLYCTYNTFAQSPVPRVIFETVMCMPLVAVQLCVLS